MLVSFLMGITHPSSSHMLDLINSHRVNPSLPQDYFGDCINAMKTSSSVSELLDHNIGWAAGLLHQSVVNHNNEVVREFVWSC